VTAIRLKQAMLRTVVEFLWLIPVVIYLVGSAHIITHVTRTKFMIMLAAHCTGQIMPATKRKVINLGQSNFHGVKLYNYHWRYSYGFAESW